MYRSRSSAASQQPQHIQAHAKMKEPPPAGRICWVTLQKNTGGCPTVVAGFMGPSDPPPTTTHLPHSGTATHRKTPQQTLQCCLSPPQDKHCPCQPHSQTLTQTAWCWGIRPTNQPDFDVNPGCVLPRSHERAFGPYPMPCKLHKHGLRHNSTQASGTRLHPFHTV